MFSSKWMNWSGNSIRVRVFFSTELDFRFLKAKTKIIKSQNFYAARLFGFFSQWEHANQPCPQWIKHASNLQATLESPLARYRAPIVSPEALTFLGPTRPSRFHGISPKDIIGMTLIFPSRPLNCIPETSASLEDFNHSWSLSCSSDCSH